MGTCTRTQTHLNCFTLKMAKPLAQFLCHLGLGRELKENAFKLSTMGETYSWQAVYLTFFETLTQAGKDNRIGQALNWKMIMIMAMSWEVGRKIVKSLTYLDFHMLFV